MRSDPVEDLKHSKVDLLLNLSSSPYQFQKPNVRVKVCSKSCKDPALPGHFMLLRSEATISSSSMAIACTCDAEWAFTADRQRVRRRRDARRSSKAGPECPFAQMI